MAEKTNLVPCVGCGALVPDIDGPVHRYIGASPGCWQIYGELQVRGAHRLAVDTYAAQHPGMPSTQSTRSVCAHLFILCLVLEHNIDPAYATRAITQFLDKYKALGLTWLEPPPSLGDMTVLNVLDTADTTEHPRNVMQWARSVWQAWEPHHGTVRAWADEWLRNNTC